VSVGALDNTARTVTRLLLEWREGDMQALEELLPLVYDELRRLARLQMRGQSPGHTLQPTALVHEAYARLVDLKLDWQDRSHFLCMAARTMRRVLVDHARAKHAAKRGAGAVQVTLHDVHAKEEPSFDLLAIDEALEALSRRDERAASAVELCYFGGLTGREIAEALQISEATAERDLRFARSWLKRALTAIKTSAVSSESRSRR
jgi:RNA polymerase sigma factor (TIGR02999 family)